jgi:hypothetical protein
MGIRVRLKTSFDVSGFSWDNDDPHLLGALRGSDFEVVDASSLMIDPDSGQTLP